MVVLLRGEDYNPVGSYEHQKRLIQRTYSEELMDAEEYNSTKYLSDLNRHKQLVLGAWNLSKTYWKRKKDKKKMKVYKVVCVDYTR